MASVKAPPSPRDIRPVAAKNPGSSLSRNEEHGWRKRKLKGLIQVKHGYPFKSEYFAESGDLVVLTPGNFLEEGGFKENIGKEKFYTSDFPREYLLDKNDLIVAMTEQAAGLLGSMAIVPESGRYLHNQRIGKVTASSNEVWLEFIYHAFKTRHVREQISNTASGSKVRHTSPERIYDVSVLLPKVGDQKRIATVLSTLDAKIAHNNRINAELEALSKLIYDYWFVQFDFPDANGRPYKTSGGTMIWNEKLKQNIPAGWSSGSLNDLGQIVGGSTPSTSNPAHFGRDMIPWITPKDLSNNKGRKFIARGETDVSEAGFRSASLTLHPAGTVLMSSRAPVGYLAIALNAVTTNQGFKSFVPSKGYSTSFVYYTVNRSLPTIIRYASGSTFVEISGGTLKSVKTVLPDTTVTDKFSTLIEPIMKRQQQAELESAEITQLRDWLLPLLMNGQVKPPAME